MKDNWLWREYMQKAALDKHSQLSVRQQIQLQERIKGALVNRNSDAAIDRSLAWFGELRETTEMTRLRTEATRLGEESNRQFGVRSEGIFNLDHDFIGLGWLKRQLQRAGAALMGRPQLGRDLFLRGLTDTAAQTERPVYELALFELLKAYAEGHRRRHAAVLTIEAPAFHSLDDAMRHLRQFIGHVPDWRDLIAFLPEELRGGVFGRSALASTFAATLELARTGRIELRQDRAFGPIYLRSIPPTRVDGAPG
jgi:hypothetical protein